jgi:hypothetical protein
MSNFSLGDSLSRFLFVSLLIIGVNSPINSATFLAGRAAFSILQQSETASVSISKEVLNYPNPFRLETGTTIYYTLSSNEDITISFYGPRGDKIKELSFTSSTNGGASGKNKVFIDRTSFDTYLPSSIYFYLIQDSAGKVIGQSQMGVLP